MVGCSPRISEGLGLTPSIASAGCEGIRNLSPQETEAEVSHPCYLIVPDQPGYLRRNISTTIPSPETPAFVTTVCFQENKNSQDRRSCLESLLLSLLLSERPDLFVCLFTFFETGFALCSPGCPGIHSGDQVGLELKEIHLPLPMLGLKALPQH